MTTKFASWRLARPARVFIAVMFCCVVLLPLSGCGGSRKVRSKVYPVTGELLINGAPPAGAFVHFHPTSGADPDVAAGIPKGQVQTNGKFAASTFANGDGLPAGEYALTFDWKSFQAMGNKYSGPDKLGDAFADPQKSTHKVTVVDKPVELGKIELQATLVEEKPQGDGKSKALLGGKDRHGTPKKDEKRQLP